MGVLNRAVMQYAGGRSDAAPGTDRQAPATPQVDAGALLQGLSALSNALGGGGAPHGVPSPSASQPSTRSSGGSSEGKKGRKEAKDAPTARKAKAKDGETKKGRKTRSRAPPSSSSESEESESSDDSSEDEESTSGDDSEREGGSKGRKGVRALSSKRLGTIEGDSNPDNDLLGKQREFISVLSRHHHRLKRVLEASPEKWRSMKKVDKYKKANAFIADAWYDSRKASTHVNNLKREIPKKKVNDGRFILALELESKEAKHSSQVIQAETKFGKLTFGGVKSLADVKERSHKLQDEYKSLPGKSEKSFGKTEVQLMLIKKIPDSHAEARAALLNEFLQDEIKGARWTVVTIEGRIALVMSGPGTANANWSNGGKGKDGKGKGKGDSYEKQKCYNCGKEGHSARACEERGKCGCKNCPCCHGGACVVKADKKIVPDGANHTKAKNANGTQLSKEILERLRDKQKKIKPELYRSGAAHESRADEESGDADEETQAEASASTFGTAVHPHAHSGPNLHASHAHKGWPAKGRGEVISYDSSGRAIRGPAGGGKPAPGRGMGRGGPGRATPADFLRRSPFKTIEQFEHECCEAHGNQEEAGSDESRYDDKSSGEESSSSTEASSASSTNQDAININAPGAVNQAVGGQQRFRAWNGVEGTVAACEAEAEREADEQLAAARRALRVAEKLERARLMREEAARVKEARQDNEFPSLPRAPSLGSSLPAPRFVPTRAEPPANRALSKRGQRKANATAASEGRPQRK